MKTNEYRVKKLVALAVCAAAVLAGCGGGDDTAPTPAPTAQVPASASASIGGFIAYLQALVVAAADTLEPVDVSAVTPPTDETSEPQAID
jgi:hypothetical protein